MLCNQKMKRERWIAEDQKIEPLKLIEATILLATPPS